jgi:4-hydroxybenzoyl-CoA thioesterase
MSGARHRWTARVRWSEVDAAGIVFYPRFFEWFDLATEALFESLGQPWPIIFPLYDIVGVPIAESGARFAAPVRYGDEVAVESAVAEVAEKTFRVEHEVKVGEVVCARGFEVRAWVGRPEQPGDRLRARAIPEEVVKVLKEGAGSPLP